VDGPVFRADLGGNAADHGHWHLGCAGSCVGRVQSADEAGFGRVDSGDEGGIWLVGFEKFAGSGRVDDQDVAWLVSGAVAGDVDGFSVIRVQLVPFKPRIVSTLPGAVRYSLLHTRLLLVPLHLTHRDRSMHRAAVTMEDRIVRVLPSLVNQSGSAAALILQEAIAVLIAIGCHPLQRGE
jgi:hypothetical protein